MKKIIRFIAAAGLGISLLAGCGNTAGTSGTESQDAAQSAGSTSEGNSTVEETAEDFFMDESASAEAAEATDELDMNVLSSEVRYSKNDESWDCPMTGFTLKIPESFKNLKGQVFTDDFGEIDANSGIFHTRLYYVASDDEALKALNEAWDGYNKDKNTDVERRSILNEAYSRYHERGYFCFLDIMAVKDGINLDAAKESAWISKSTEGENIELGKAGNYTFYCLARDYTSMEKPIRDSFTDAYYEEFATLVADAENIAANITVKEPRPLEKKADVDVKVSFETKDLDGNTVRSEDIFAGHKVTMINIWATWCGPCQEELSTLEKLNKEYGEKGCQIIGICDDTADDNAMIDIAKSILKEKGVTYTNLVQTEELRSQLAVAVLPTSFFVDSEGKILNSAVEGVMPELYKTRFDEGLKITEG